MAPRSPTTASTPRTVEPSSPPGNGDSAVEERRTSPPSDSSEQPRRRRPQRTSPRSEFTNSLKSLPENVMISSASSPLGDECSCVLEESERTSSSLDDSDKSGALAAEGVRNGATYNGRRPPRRANRFRNPLSSSQRMKQKQQAAAEMASAATGNNGNAAGDLHGSAKLGGSAKYNGSWQCNTDWDLSAYDSHSSSNNASQASLYHVIDELDDLDKLNGRDDGNDGSDDCGDDKQRRKNSWLGWLPDMSSERSLGNNNNPPGLMDVSDRSSLYNSGYSLNLNGSSSSSALFGNNSSSALFGNNNVPPPNASNAPQPASVPSAPSAAGASPGGASSGALPRRGVPRQSSARAFRRSVQETIRQDEDLSSSAFFGTSHGSLGSLGSGVSVKSGHGGLNESFASHQSDGGDPRSRRGSDRSDLEHVFGDMLLDDDGR